MSNKQILLLLKVIMIIGLCFIAIGIYLHFYSESMHARGVNGIIISASFVAIGMIMSIPTKMYLTFLLMCNEANKRH